LQDFIPLPFQRPGRPKGSLDKIPRKKKQNIGFVKESCTESKVLPPLPTKSCKFADSSIECHFKRMDSAEFEALLGRSGSIDAFQSKEHIHIKETSVQSRRPNFGDVPSQELYQNSKQVSIPSEKCSIIKTGDVSFYIMSGFLAEDDPFHHDWAL
jgi:hypothetical protein